MSGFSDLPLPDPLAGGLPIPLSAQVHQGTEIFHIVGRFLGGGMTAGRLHDELEPVVMSSKLSDIQTALTNTGDYVSGPLVTEINEIHQDLAEAYQGQATDQMATQFTAATKTCGEMGPKFSKLAGQVNVTQDALNDAWKSVANYSRLHSDASNVASAVPFGGDSDDDKAENAWNTCKGQLGHAGDTAAGVGTGSGWHTGPNDSFTPVNTNPPAGYENPGGTGPGPGHYGPGPGPGFSGPGPGTGPGPGPGPGPGFGPGYGGPGGPGHAAGYTPAHYDTAGVPGYHPGHVGAGPGGGPGAGLDTGSDLAGYSGGPGAGVGAAGLGGAGDPSGLAGGGSGSGLGSGADGAGAAGRPGVGGVPMGARGGGGSGNDSERERSTWLTEDDDIWGDSDAPGGVIS